MVKRMHGTKVVQKPGAIDLCSQPQYVAQQSRTEAARRRRPDLNRSYLIPVLSKALVILRLLESSDAPMRIQEVCRRTGYAQSTVYRILRTLSVHGYIPESAGKLYSFRRVKG